VITGDFAIIDPLRKRAFMGHDQARCVHAHRFTSAQHVRISSVKSDSPSFKHGNAMPKALGQPIAGEPRIFLTLRPTDARICRKTYTPSANLPLAIARGTPTL
jgi:hypothetical protein